MQTWCKARFTGNALQIAEHVKKYLITTFLVVMQIYNFICSNWISSLVNTVEFFKTPIFKTVYFRSYFIILRETPAASCSVTSKSYVIFMFLWDDAFMCGFDHICFELRRCRLSTQVGLSTLPPVHWTRVCITSTQFSLLPSHVRGPGSVPFHVQVLGYAHFSLGVRTENSIFRIRSVTKCI